MQRRKYKLVVILPWTESLTLQSSFFFFWVLNQTDNFPGQQHSAWQLANVGYQTWTGTQLQEPRLSRWIRNKVVLIHQPTTHRRVLGTSTWRTTVWTTPWSCATSSCWRTGSWKLLTLSTRWATYFSFVSKYTYMCQFCCRFFLGKDIPEVHELCRKWLATWTIFITRIGMKGGDPNGHRLSLSLP